MSRTLILGAGKIGAIIAEMLAETGDFEVTLADADPAHLTREGRRHRISRTLVDVRDPAALRAAMRGAERVVSALPYYLNIPIAEAARDVGLHYFDLTEDVATTQRVRDLARDAKTAFVPQCGLAPGFIGIAAHALSTTFDRLREVRLRVGALPLYPDNGLKYNLTWSTDGLINEYCNPCEAILDGRRRELLALEGLEHFSLDGLDYEAFNTSGGVGSLCETLDGKVETLTYKTVRYPGHRDIMKLLLSDLRLSERRELLKDVLENAVPVTHQDVVLIFVTVAGWRDGRLTQESYARKVYGGSVAAHPEWSAIQITTAAGLCAMVDLHREGRLPRTGFVRQEQADLADILANRFGRYYANGQAGEDADTRSARAA